MSETALLSATSPPEAPSTSTATAIKTAVHTAPPSPKNFKAQKQTKLSTFIQFDISNKTALADLSKRYNPPQPQGESTIPSKKSSYFEKLDVATRLELDHGLSHIIDVQPDLRFPLQYFMYYTAEEYPELNAKSHPYVSIYIRNYINCCSDLHICL